MKTHYIINTPSRAPELAGQSLVGSSLYMGHKGARAQELPSREYPCLVGTIDVDQSEAYDWVSFWGG